MLESFFIVLVLMLLILSALDLFVGVSNDAANFLNSAMGCRIAPLGVVLLVACLGVLLGATFSSGMMEVARKGMFHPEMFSYYDVMLVFAAVMISDVLLLNIFNSFGLPTSTTVSVVFELLGAAVFASFYLLTEKGLSYGEIFEYIKLDRTATIVTAILTSVAVAFICGMAVQFVCRLMFTFRFNRTYKYLGGIFTGISLCAISYFLIIKGARGASFMQPEYIAWLDQHLEQVIWGGLVGFTVLGQIMALCNLNIFRLIILSGTFALAFSFAGNDLVNFVGVPLAALDSFLAWSESGVESHYYAMSVLNEDARTSTIWLFIAGLIMSITLCTSKKARQVVQTSINLSTSTRGEREQFGASFLGRVITRMGLMVSRFAYLMMPQFVLRFVNKRYRKAPVIKGQIPLPFDYVRASVNLVLASALISVATSYKLPLSTTYVTFMVAMGSSFADGAWDRESAVYRISGVVTVIAGWFLTGICAFTNAFFIAFLLFNLGLMAALALIVVVIAVVVYTNFIRKAKTATATGILTAKTDQEILETVTRAVPSFYAENVVCLQRALSAFFDDNEFHLRKTRNKASNIQEAISNERSAYYGLALDTDFNSRFSLRKEQQSGGTIDAKFFFYLVFSNMREAAKSVRYALDQAVNHVANRHTIFAGEMRRSLFDLAKRLDKINEDMQLIGKAPNAENVEAMIKHTKKLNRDIDKYQLNLVSIIGRERVSMHSSEIYLTFLQSMRDLANRYAAVSMQERALAELVANNAVMTPLDTASLQTEVMPAALTSHAEPLVKKATREERDEEIWESSLANSAISLPKSPAAQERSEHHHKSEDSD